MDISSAIMAMQEGERVTRLGWNGKNQWVRIVDLYTDREFTVIEHEPCIGTWLPFMVIKTVDNQLVPWTISQADAQADDWVIMPGVL